MALEKAFTDGSGVHHEHAYWRPIHVGIDIVAKRIQVTFGAWRDKIASDEGLDPLVATRSYSVTGSQFVNLMSAHTTPGGPSLPSMIYAHAKAYDIFFASAKDV